MRENICLRCGISSRAYSLYCLTLPMFGAEGDLRTHVWRFEKKEWWGGFNDYWEKAYHATKPFVYDVQPIETPYDSRPDQNTGGNTFPTNLI